MHQGSCSNNCIRRFYFYDSLNFDGTINRMIIQRKINDTLKRSRILSISKSLPFNPNDSILVIIETFRALSKTSSSFSNCTH